ncbi:MAG: hypothetical protein QOH72_1323 [Solirubrobacteraceae bacterium]|jgi:hypothetical protein|nr:hypothetical protein [Solirubrobacteraceae bacterium]
MTSPPRVTVVIAAFNEERFIAEAIESALAQDYPAGLVEAIVVDDGSTDATAAIAAGYEATGRVRVVRRANGGNVAAANTAFARADGDVVAILDADDLWAIDHLRRSVEVLEARPEVGLVYGDMTVIDERGEVLQESWLRGDATPEGRCLGAQLVGNNVTSSSIVVRGSLLRELGPIPPGMPWADWWLAVSFARVSELAYLPEPRTRYRFHGANMSLGARGDARRGELCKAAGFQRHLLRTIGPGDATPRELVDGWAAFERNTGEAVALGGSPFRRAFDVTAADRAEAEALALGALRALVAGDASDALWPFVRAAAADPWNDTAREGLAAALAAAPGGEDLPGQRPLDGAAPFVVLAVADELLEHPALLRAYADGMGGAGGVTLAVDATAMDAAAVGDALGALVHEVGVDDSIDLLAVAGPLDELGRARLAAGVHAVLTDRTAGALARPRFGAGEVDALRRLSA